MQSCNGCGADFTVEHALDYKSDTLVGHQHDPIGDLPSLVWGNVVHEPVTCDQSASLDGTLAADLCTC